MAGIKADRHNIFKIGTDKLKYNKWNLNISEDEAFKLEEISPLFQAQSFRLIAQMLNEMPKNVKYMDYMMAVVIDKLSDFNRAVSKKGIIVNGITFKRFVGTTGGLKGNTLLFVNEDILEELNRRCDCNRNTNIPLVPAKYEAYKALTCSASQEIISPKKILVVRDCITKFKDTVIKIDDTDTSLLEPSVETLENVELENNVSDGYNLCTIEFMTKVCEALGIDYVSSGVCLRNAWLKGMLYPFPIIEFIEKYNNGNYFIEDIWGNTQDIRECEMILTESSLKLWSSYDSIEHYMDSYKNCGYEFAVTKISPKELDNYREVNYQYLQSYELTDEDIEELCQPTVDFLTKAMCGDYQSTIEFLGINGFLNDNSWQQALYTSDYMLNDPYIIDSVHRMIKGKINDAKIGKLQVKGNYQIASGDPFALMQSICGLEVTGLLKADECYSNYWNELKEDEVVIFRSPMTCHENIRKCKCVDNEEVRYWYQYMNTIMIINGWDTFCMAENGCDFDSDILFSTNNNVLKRRHIKLPALMCIQKDTNKKIVTERDIIATNKAGMGNAVGSITNRVTAMKEVQSRFKKGSREYNELTYRMRCGQLYQQNCLDKIKGIVSRNMPNHWYHYKSCGDDEFQKSICADKKPYFMIYVYDNEKSKYTKFIKEGNNKSKVLYGMTVDELRNKEPKTEDEIEFLMWFDRLMPVGMGDCAMNRICKYIESIFDDKKIELKANSEFDYNVLKVKRRCTEKHREELYELSKEYALRVSVFKSKRERLTKSEREDKRSMMREWFYNQAKEICPNDEERLNILLDLCYAYKNNKQFFWDCAGDLMIKRLEEMKCNSY